VLSFGLSLIANYLLVAGLAVLGIYRPAVLYAVFTSELIVLLWLDRARLAMPLGDVISRTGRRAWTFFREFERDCPIRSRWIRPTMIAAAITVICGFAVTGISEIGQIFQQWDAVVSWNRWAIEWAANRPPQMTSYYPQLLPTNMSLSYVLMQTNEVWVFAKAMQFLFCLMLLLAMLDVARRPENFGLVPGVVITYALLLALVRYRMLNSGYADVPLAFFAWMPIYALLRAEHAGNDMQRLKWVVMGALFAAGAALTKQLGLYMAAVYPLLAWAWLPRRCRVASSAAKSHQIAAISGGSRRTRPHPNAAFRILSLYLLIALLVAPWYVYKVADFQSGRDVDNTPILLRDSHEGRDLQARLAHAGSLLADAMTLPGGALLLIALAASLCDRRARWLLGLFIPPLGLLWAAAFSYDLRNLAMLAPFVGAAAGIGLVRIIGWAEREKGRRGEWEKGRTGAVVFPSLTPHRASLRVWHATGFAALVLIASLLRIRDESLLSLQRHQLRQVGIPGLNDRLYEFSHSPSDRSMIATDYLALRWLPDIGPRSVACASDDLATFRKSFDRADVHYVIVRSDGIAPEVRRFLARPRAARLLFEEHGYAMYEKAQTFGVNWAKL
jgi:hypothetical protein